MTLTHLEQTLYIESLSTLSSLTNDPSFQKYDVELAFNIPWENMNHEELVIMKKVCVENSLCSHMIVTNMLLRIFNLPLTE